MFDVRTDAGGQDPDSHSRTLRRYHQLLWSKPLPHDTAFDLDADCITILISRILAQQRRHRPHLNRLGQARAPCRGYSAGPQPRDESLLQPWLHNGCLPGVPGADTSGREVQQPINQRRSTHPRIRDRFDLTLERIRRHYLGPGLLTKSLTDGVLRGCWPVSFWCFPACRCGSSCPEQ